MTNDTPPADDVRKALSIAVLRAADEDKPVWERGLDEIVNAVLAAFEVRPRGTVTDAEVDAALRSYWGASDGLSDSEFEDMRAAIEAARSVSGS